MPPRSMDLQDLEALRLGRRATSAGAIRRADRRRRSRLLLAVAGLAAAAFLTVTFRPGFPPRAASGERAAAPAPSIPAPPPPEPNKLSAVAETFLTDGPVTLSSEVAGTLVDAGLNVGDVVRASQVVARIDPQPYQARLEEARAALAIARSEEQLAYAELERSRSLSEHEILSVSKFRDASTRWEIAGMRVRQAEARVGETERQLAACVLRSPIEGLVTRRYAHTGEFLLPGETPVIEISDLKKLAVQAFVAESDLGRLREHAPATVELKSFPDATFSARVSLIDPIVDLSRGTARVELELAAPAPRLRPGLTGQAWIQTGAPESALLSSDAPTLSSFDSRSD